MNFDEKARELCPATHRLSDYSQIPCVCESPAAALSGERGGRGKVNKP